MGGERILTDELIMNEGNERPFRTPEVARIRNGPANQKCGTGGKGSITQWVHAEYMEGSETIRPTFTQWVRGVYFSKVPTKVPTG